MSLRLVLSLLSLLPFDLEQAMVAYKVSLEPDCRASNGSGQDQIRLKAVEC